MDELLRALLAERFGTVTELERERRPMTPARLLAARRRRLITAIPESRTDQSL